LGVKIPPNVRPGHDAVDKAARAVSAEYERVIPNLRVTINGPQFAQAITPAAQALKPAEQKELQRLLSLHLGKGKLQGQALKDAQGELRRLAGVYKRSQNANERLLGFALDDADDALTSSMIQQNPAWAPQLQKVNTAYRGLKIVEDAASRADEGLISTGQLKQSVRRADRSKGKSQTARGNAFMQEFSEDARAVIPARTPDSGTAGRNFSGNIFNDLDGLMKLGGFKTSQVLTQARLIPRPLVVQKAGAGVRRLRAPAGAAAVATAQGSRN
jgi:hypothetical protein